MKTRTLILLLAVLTGNQTMALEKPEYEVLYEAGDIEYRLYKPYLIAETEVSGSTDRNAAANAGFMRLFKYITGGNTQQAAIDMTAPVQQAQPGEKIDMTAPVQQVGNADSWTISFMLPGKFSLLDAPVPTDERIKIREVPGRLMAVIRYSGRWTSRNVDKYQTILMEQLQEDGINSIGTAETAAYNPPFTPPFMRRNEIMVEVSSYPGTLENQLVSDLVNIE